MDISSLFELTVDSSRMIQGLYKVAFKGPAGSGNGVVIVNGGRFEGGDSSLYYYGTLTENGSAITGHLNVRRHSQGAVSVFGPDNISVQISGTVTPLGFSLTAPGGFSAMGTSLQT